jgi:CMP-N,N'-diacetyllegionaminic acid synthase
VMDGRRCLAVVPARGGSKGIRLKNLRPFLGRALVARVGDVVRAAGFFDRAVVSTDHDGIARAAGEAGLSAPFVRPPELSGDLVGDLDVLAHALSEVERADGVCYDVVVMLQPTSPLRTAAHVTAVVRKLVREGWDAVWTVSATDARYHPLKALALGPDGALALFDARGAAIVARQQLAPAYHRNGAAYAFTRACLLDRRTILPPRTAAVVLEEPMVSIDTEDDLRKAESLAREREKPGSGPS